MIEILSKAGFRVAQVRDRIQMVPHRAPLEAAHGDPPEPAEVVDVQSGAGVDSEAQPARATTRPRGTRNVGDPLVRGRALVTIAPRGSLVAEPPTHLPFARPAVARGIAGARRADATPPPKTRRCSALPRGPGILIRGRHESWRVRLQSEGRSLRSASSLTRISGGARRGPALGVASSRISTRRRSSPTTCCSEWRDAGVSTARLGINSTVGVAGLGDPATPMGFLAPFRFRPDGRSASAAAPTSSCHCSDRPPSVTGSACSSISHFAPPPTSSARRRSPAHRAAGHRRHRRSAHLRDDPGRRHRLRHRESMPSSCTRSRILGRFLRHHAQRVPSEPPGGDLGPPPGTPQGGCFAAPIGSLPAWAPRSFPGKFPVPRSRRDRSPRCSRRPSASCSPCPSGSRR